jgi:hypothetical protein
MGLRRWLLAVTAPISGGSKTDEPSGKTHDPLIVTGMTSASGASGFMFESASWSLALHLIVWRQASQAPILTELRLEKKLPSEAALQLWMQEIRPGTLVRMRLASPPQLQGSRFEAELAQYVGRAEDLEIATLAEPMLSPPPFSHPQLGVFLAEPRIPDLFKGKVNWGGREVVLQLDVKGTGSLVDRAAAMLHLLADPARWIAEIENRIYEDYHQIWHDSWRDENEPELSRMEWLARLRLESITIAEQGNFSSDFSDGGLFWGHGIFASGSIDEGILHSQMWG